MGNFHHLQQMSNHDLRPYTTPPGLKPNPYNQDVLLLLYSSHSVIADTQRMSPERNKMKKSRLQNHWKFSMLQNAGIMLLTRDYSYLKEYGSSTHHALHIPCESHIHF